MKILLVNTFVGSSSTGNLTYEICKTNIENGNECVMAYGRNGVKNREGSYRISNKLDYTLHGLWTRITDLNGFASKGVTKKFLEFIDEYKPDVIHLHNLHGYYINIKILFEYLKAKNIPIVWTFHDCWPYTGHCAYYTNIGCEKWKTECYACPQKKRYPTSYILDNSKANYRKKKRLFTGLSKMVITPVSKWLENEVRQSFFKKCNIETVYNGVDLSVFKPTQSNFREKNGLIGKKILLGVAINWTLNKGLIDLIKLGEIVASKYQVVVVGLSKKQIESLPNYILGIEKILNVQELVEIYSASDVFVNPSREETFGMVTAEAMACGTPVVVYDTTASPELVDEKTGRVVEVGNIVGIYEAVKGIDKRVMSECCVKRAHELFDKDKNQFKYIEIYNRIIGR